MSRITGREVFELMEAYRSIYEGYDEKKEKNVPVEDLTILEGKMHEHYVNDEKNAEVLGEAGNPGAGIAATQQRQRQAQAQGAKQALQQGKSLGVAGNFGMQSGTTVKMDSAATRAQGRTVVTASNPQNRGARGGTTQTRPNEINLGGQKMYAARLGGKDVYVSARKPGANPPGAKPPGANPPGAKPPGANPPGAKPPGGTPAPAAAKPAPSAPAAKPAAPQKSFNPLMQKTFGYQTGNAPDQIAKASAGAPPTPSGSALGAAAKPEVRSALNLPSKPAASLSQAPEVKKTAEIAKKPVQPAVAPTSTQMRQGTFREEVDAYDLVLEYLLANGHADTVDEAHYVMLEMDSEMIQNIIEVVTTTGEKAPKAVPSQMFPQAPRMGAERPFEKPFINPSGAPFRGASKPVKKDTKTA